MLLVHIRWMIVQDLPQVLAIESEVFEDDAWDGEEFKRWLKQRCVIGLVAEHDGEVVGYCVYEMTGNTTGGKTKARVVVNFVVAPEWQRNGVGRQIISKLVERYTGPVIFEVSEYDLSMHLFLRAVGFRAKRVVRDYFESGSDAYIFTSRKSKASA